MKQGWIKSYRSDIESDVWAMPPLYYRVWHYILLSVNYEEKDIPMKDGSHLKILRGQYLTSIRTICKDIGWYEGGIFKEPNPKTVKEILDWMEKVGLITVEHGKFNRQYSLITIVNYEDIQRDDLGIEMADKSYAAWGEVVKCIRDFGMYRFEEALLNMSEKTARVVKQISWSEICLCENLSVIRGQFMKMYEILEEREKKDKLMPEDVREQIKRVALKRSDDETKLIG